MGKCQECGRSDEGMALAQTVMNNTIDQLRTELAATQLQLKEAREALASCESGWPHSVQKMCEQALSSPADTSALDRLLAEKDAQIKELREALEKIARLDDGGFPVFTYQQREQFALDALSRPADTTALNRYVAGATETAWAQASRLAMELECLLLSSKDTAAVSKWWDSAHEALDEYRRVFADELEGK